MTNERKAKVGQGNYNENIKGDYIQTKVVKSGKLSLKYIVLIFLILTSLLGILLVKYKPNSSVKIDNSSGVVTGKVEGNLDIKITGDTTNTSQERAKLALLEIQEEIQSNFQSLSLAIQGIKSNKPQPFWDIRRANESELDYQGRARDNFLIYINGIGSQLKLLNYTQEAYKGLRSNLVEDNESANHIKKVYERLDEVQYSLTSFEIGLTHILSLENISDQERTERSYSLQREKIASARMDLSNAAAYFSLILTEKIDAKMLSDSLKDAGINIDLKPGKEGYKEALHLAKKFAQEKLTVLQERTTVIEKAKQREVERIIKDPYLAMVRKATGLPPTLSESEVFALQNKQINQEEKDPIKLFQLAAYSFLESDGHASAIYFERAIKSNSLSPLQQKFAQLSINRLKNPEIYEGSLGIMVIKITPNGNFDRAGLKEGDVIVSFNGKTINEPREIASEIGKSGDNPNLLEIIRDEQSLRKVIDGGESAGAILSQLIVLNAIQL